MINMKMENKNYANYVEDEVCNQLLATATRLLVRFTRSGLTSVDDYYDAREKMESSGYGNGFLPVMRDMMIKWLEEAAPGKMPVRKDCNPF